MFAIINTSMKSVSDKKKEKVCIYEKLSTIIKNK